jgi:hypothetical protein
MAHAFCVVVQDLSRSEPSHVVTAARWRSWCMLGASSCVLVATGQRDFNGRCHSVGSEYTYSAGPGRQWSYLYDLILAIASELPPREGEPPLFVPYNAVPITGTILLLLGVLLSIQW